MRKNIFTSIGIAVVLVVTAFTAGGCSSLSSGLALPTFRETSSPSQIVAVWDPIIRHENDKVYRGLAARVIFYEAGNKKALRVKGDFDIYVFDENAKDQEKPSKVIRYCADDLKYLESDSKLLGKSYSVWFPWDEATEDSKKTRLSVFIRFKATDGSGAMIVSHQTTVDLPGSDPNEELAEQTVSNPYLEDKKLYMDKLEKIAEERHIANSNHTGIEEWKATVAEHIITRENRPQAMVTTTINMPGVSRDGIPTITPERRYALASDEQKHNAQVMVANARLAQQNQLTQQQNPQSMPNAIFAIDQSPANNASINQVQFQSSQQNGLTQPLQPAFDRNVPQNVTQNANSNDEGALYREFLTWKQQQNGQVAQIPSQQQPLGNFAAANTGVAWQ